MIATIATIAAIAAKKKFSDRCDHMETTSLMQHLRKGKSLALKICDPFDKSFVKNPGECLFSSGNVIVCDFFNFVYLFI